MTGRCPQCSREVGVRRDGTLYNHLGRTPQLFCTGAGMRPTVLLTPTPEERLERLDRYLKGRPS